MYIFIIWTFFCLILFGILESSAIQIKKVSSNENWNSFLIQLEDKLSEYENQEENIINRVMNMRDSYKNHVRMDLHNLNGLKKFAEDINCNESYSNMGTLTANKTQLKKLLNLFDDISHKPQFTCSSSQMIVQGFNIKMNDIVNQSCWQTAKDIQIFALNKIFIDSDVIKESGQISIFAPTWEVIGSHKIILNGRNGALHKNPTALGNGNNGQPGLPGEAGGYFLGVGQQFTNATKLKIEANGGNGGPGQNGANGYVEPIGEPFKMEYESTVFDPDEFRALLKKLNINKDSDYYVPHAYIFDIRGVNVSLHHDGGDGGAGGIAGPAGSIHLIGFDTMPVLESIPGKVNGSIGIGGSASIHQPNERYGRCNIKNTFGTYSPPICRWEDKNVLPIHWKHGRDGYNIKNRKAPETGIKNPSFAINSYKQFLMKNLATTTEKSNFKKIIGMLERNPVLNSLYDTVGDINELQGLESIYLQDRNTIGLLSSYKSFLNRIPKHGRLNQPYENKRAEVYAMTAAFGKLCLFKKFNHGESVVNLTSHLDSLMESIENFSQSDYLRTVQTHRDNYKKFLSKKIQYTNEMIRNEIMPEIVEFSKSLDEKVSKLKVEINQNKNVSSIEEKKDSLASMRIWQRTIRVMMVAENAFNLDYIPSAVVGLEVDMSQKNSIIPKIMKIYNDKIKESIQSLKEANDILKKAFLVLPVTQRNETMEELNRYEFDITELNNTTVNTIVGFEHNSQNIEEIKLKMMDLINSYIKQQEQKYEAENGEKNTRKNPKKLKGFKKLKRAQHILNGLGTVFEHIRKEKERPSRGQISHHHDSLNSLRQIENSVYSTMYPIFHQFEKNLNHYSNLSSESLYTQFGLIKWNIRNELSDAMSLVHELIHSMSSQMQQQLQYGFDKLNELVTVMMDIYDHIGYYSDRVQLVHYMRQINLENIDDLYVRDTNSKIAIWLIDINDLRLTIKSNIFLEIYEQALQLFKQHYFPLAPKRLNEFELPSRMQLNTITSNVIHQIKEMRDLIAEDDVESQNYKNIFHRKKKFDSKTIASSPFYVWKHNTFGDDIGKLLQGDEITIKADIFKGVNYNAIKYHDIGINFKFHNQTVQKEFDSVIQNFRLDMSAIGNNHYRCADRFYYIPIPNEISISYILGKQLDSNTFLRLINQNQAFLSPYAIWTMKLSNLTKNVQFNSLRKYKDESVDLELVGEGSYIERNSEFDSEICNQMLDTFYNFNKIPFLFM